jgi:hypothetical protein
MTARIMTPTVRKFVLTVHLTASVGWMGSVIAYLALVVAAMTNPDAQTLRNAWFAMALIGWYVIVPLALGSLLTGIVMSVGTSWGLFRHYWVLLSLALTVFATVVLLIHMQTAVSPVATIAANTPSASIVALDGELFHAGVGLLVLLVIQVMNVYKPRGMTAYGWRKQQQRAARTSYSSVSDL